MKDLSFYLVSNFLQRSGVLFDVEFVRDKLTALNDQPSLLFTEKLNILLKSIPGANRTIRSTSSRQFEKSNCPALAFIEHQWKVLFESDGELHVLGEDGNIETISVNDLPVTVVIWLHSPNNGYMSNTEEYITDSIQLIKSVALKQKRWILDLALATIVVNVFAVLTSMFAMQVYDRVVPTLAFNTLYTLVTGVVIVYLLDLALKVLRSKILDYRSSKIDVDISGRIFTHLLNLQLDKQPKSLGTLSAQVNGLESARQFFSSTIVFLLVDLPFAFFFLAVIWMIGGVIGWIYFGFFMLSMTIALISQSKNQKLSKILTTRSNERLGIMVDTIKGNETIRATGAVQDFQLEWNKIGRSISEYSLKQKALTSLTSNVSSTLGSVAYTLAVVAGVHAIGQGQLTMGAMIACSILGGRVLGPVGQAVSYLLQYENVRQSIAQVNGLLKLPLQRDASQSLLFPNEEPQSITLEGVSFRYEEKSPTILSIDKLAFQRGDRVALLGNIGSGKSTLLKVIAGLYRPIEGRVRYGVVDLWELDPFYISRNVGYLSQSVDLFKGTLRSNLTLGVDVSDTRLMDVCEALSIDKIAAQSEKGLDLPINEGGTGLSGGQRQLVGLARLALNAPTIWLLDEPTASLDSVTQSKVISELSHRIRPSDIVIYATHNPALATEWSNRVIFMEAGQISKDVPTEQIVIKRKTA